MITKPAQCSEPAYKYIVVEIFDLLSEKGDGIEMNKVVMCEGQDIRPPL